MLGYALQFGTQAVAATVGTLVELGQASAYTLLKMMQWPIHAMEVAIGPRPARSPSKQVPLARAPRVCMDPETLAAYADGFGGAEERAQMESHLAGCRACRASIALALSLDPADPGLGTAFRA